jgi:hypothetical protein
MAPTAGCCRWTGPAWKTNLRRLSRSCCSSL